VTFTSSRNIQRAIRISVCVTAVCNSHKFFVESSLTFLYFSTTTPTPSNQRVIIFSTTTQGIRLWRRVDVFQRRRTLQRVDLWRRRDIDFSLDSRLSWTISRDFLVCRKSPSLQCHLVEYVVSSNMSVTTECYCPMSIILSVLDSLWDNSTMFRRRRDLLFQFRLQFFDDATICSDDVIFIFFWLTRTYPLQIVT